MLTQASKTYAARRPGAPDRGCRSSRSELTAAAKKIGTNLGKGLDAQGAHAKRLRKLDGSNTMGAAVDRRSHVRGGGERRVARRSRPRPRSPGTGTP